MSHHRRRSTGALFAVALMLGAGAALPGHAAGSTVTPYPGETREAFAARAALEDQRKSADGDQAADAIGAGAFAASTGSSSGLFGGFMSFGFIGLITLVLTALRMSRGLFSASRSIARVSGLAQPSQSFEERIAEQLRAMEPNREALPTMAAPMPIPVEFASVPPAPVPASDPAPSVAAPALRQPGPPLRPPAGVRTFGRRVS